MNVNTIRKPDWLKVKLPDSPIYGRVLKIFRKYNLHTVCEEALCPNIAECWGSGTGTLMILGEVCTRSCRFCAVKRGNPMGKIDESEPLRVAMAVKELGLKYVVVTSVCRDDLPDGGASHFAKTIKSIKENCPNIVIEALIPDFRGNINSIREVVEANPDVICHNVETVRRLSSIARDRRASFQLSIDVLRSVKRLNPSITTKTSIMLGLGETEYDVIETLKLIRDANVDIVFMGQYLRPSRDKLHLPVKEYIKPSVFEKYRKIAESMGFKLVVAGPLVRSSYRAAEFFVKNNT
ncbi:MAG: lipoyl synthase [Nitrososphaerota archaeon]